MAFELQILHASDLEGGVDAIGRAPNFAALVDLLEDQVANSVTISAGDNYIPGPFFNAALFVDDQPFNDAANQLFDLPRDVDGDGSDDVYESLEAGRGRIDIAIMNTIGFDASAVGNHEFDLGTDQFAEIIAPALEDAGLADDAWLGTQFPYLSANLDFSGDSNLSGLATDAILTPETFVAGPEESLSGSASPRIAPAAILERGGEQIGVVGATTQILESITSNDGTEVIGPESNDMPALADILQPVIDDLEAQGVNKIILTSHLQQIALEEELIGLLSGVDVVLAGGSDTLLADETDTLRSGDTAEDSYPIVTQNADGDPALVVSTDGEYSYVGRLVVEFDDNGVVLPESVDAAESGAFATTDAVVSAVAGESDPFAEGTKGAEVQALVDTVDSVVQEQDGNTFGRSDVFLDGRRSEVRTEETNLGNLTADANLAAAQQVDSSVQVSIKNGGGIRAPIGEVAGSDQAPELLPPQANPDAGKETGEVSQLDITNSLRFDNGLTLITLTPEQLLQTLEHAVAGSGAGSTPGQFGQVGGLQFRFDELAPEGDRVESVALIDEAGNPTQTIVADGEVVDGAPESIRVVTLGFLADGGDDYPFQDFVDADPEFANRVDLEGTDLPDGAASFSPEGGEQDALADYMAAQFSQTPFNEAETSPLLDTRIQHELYDTLGQLYAGYLGRAPDPEGLEFWFETVRDTGDLRAAAQGFAASQEAQDLLSFLADPSTDQDRMFSFLDTVYDNLFDRDIGEGGFAFWSGQIASRLDSGEGIGTLILDIISGAQGDDATVLENRGDIAREYAADFAAAEAEWTVADDLIGATDVLAGVDASDGSLSAARAQIDDLIAAEMGESESALVGVSGPDGDGF